MPEGVSRHSIDWEQAYVEWTFSQVAHPQDKRVLEVAAIIHIPISGGLNASFPLLAPPDLESENAPVDRLEIVDASGKPLREVQEGDRVFIRAEGKTLCPKAISTLAVKVRPPGGKDATVILRETAPGSGVLLGPEGGLVAHLPAGNDEAHLVVTAEGAMVRAAYEARNRRALTQEASGGHLPPPMPNLFGPTVRSLAANLSAAVVVHRGRARSDAKGPTEATAGSSSYYDGPPFEARVTQKITILDPPQPITGQGRLLMRPGAWRLEVEMPGMPAYFNTITIYREDTRLQWTLFPHTHTYQEVSLAIPRIEFEKKEQWRGRTVRKYCFRQGSYSGWEWRDDRGIPVRRSISWQCGKNERDRCTMEMTLSEVQERSALDDSLFEIPTGYVPMASPIGALR